MKHPAIHPGHFSICGTCTDASDTRWLHNLFSLATGLGITTNIIDCYCAILSMWEPGDRIFVFGFSRGAYTVRCLAAVLSMCGVPTTMADGKTPLRRDVTSTSVRRPTKIT